MAKCIGTVKINTRLGIVFAPAFMIRKYFAVAAHPYGDYGRIHYVYGLYNVIHIPSGYAMNTKVSDNLNRAKEMCERLESEIPESDAQQSNLLVTQSSEIARAIWHEFRENW